MKNRKMQKSAPPSVIVFESPRNLLTLNEAASYLRISRRTIYTLMTGKQLAHTRVRGAARFRLSALNDYLDKRTVAA